MSNVQRDVGVAMAAIGTNLGAVSLEDGSAPPLTSRVVDFANLTVKKTPVGERRDVFEAPTKTLQTLECHITTLNPGETPHPPHRHPDEEMLVIREGTLEVSINGATSRAGPGSVVFFASNDLHGARSVGDVPATYHVFRWVSAATPKADAN